MRSRGSSAVETPLAALIDVVFQLIIFFVVTASVDKDLIDEQVNLAQAKYMHPAVIKDPRQVTINVRKDGTLNINMNRVSPLVIQQVLTASRARFGDSVPILVRCDGEVLYDEVDKVMQSVGKAGLYKVRLAAVATK
jgi:biopolymer transport protein ExbD